MLIISHWWLASLLICLLFCSVQCVSSLPLLAFIAARSHRSRTDYAVCDNLSALPRFAVLSSPLAHLHVTRHAQEFAFVMLCQRVGLSAKRQDR